MHFSLVRRKILRLPSCPIPTCASYNTLATYSLLPRETQDFASLHAAATIIINSKHILLYSVKPK